MHNNKLKPSLERDRYTWSKRKEDIDVWTRPHPIFGQNEPVTIHKAGQRLQEERLAALSLDQEKWQSRVVVDDTSVHFHRCVTETELLDRGFKSSNALSRLQGLLKDPPHKLTLKKPGFYLKDIPALNVVLNPSVDTTGRVAGLSPLPALDSQQDQEVKGFAPGPYQEYSWVLERNKIPVRDYQHQKFAKLKGQDFK